MKIIGRENELKRLTKFIDSDGLSAAFIFGRRRIGKSELIHQLLRQSNVRGFYYECKQVAQKSNVISLAEVLSESMNLPRLEFENIEEILRYIFELAKKEKIILVLDEYPYLRESVKGMNSILQSLIDVLEKLIKMEVVVKKAPINDENNKKRAGYYIADNLSSFYYRYIFKYSFQMNIMNSEVFYKKYIEKDFEEQYVSHAFEEIFRQYLIRLNKSGKTNPIFMKIGKYYYDNPKEHSIGELDIVTEDERGFIFYEVKFGKKPMTDQMIACEMQQVKDTGINCYKYVFISRSGFECKEADNIGLIGLNELFE